MAIDPEALARFLSKELPFVPDFKGRHPDELLGQIFTDTGSWYLPKTPPRYPQLVGLTLALHLRRSLMFYDMRMGKTKIGFDFAAHLRQAGRWRGKGLVIAHAPLGALVWERQAPIHTDLRVRRIRSGPQAGKQLAQALEDDSDLLVMAWSTLQTLFTEKRVSRKGVSKLYPDLEALSVASGAFDLAIIDEIHTCQNHLSLRFQIAEALVAEARYRLGLTGTPIGRYPFRIWPQVYLMDGGALLSRSYYFFEAAFGKKKKAFRGQGKPLADEYVFDKAKHDLLQEWLKSVSMSYKRTEVQEENIFPNVVELEMTEEQQEAYDELLQRAIEMSQDDSVQRDNIFTRMRQVASGYLPFRDDENETRIKRFAKAAKLEWLGELLDDFEDAADTLPQMVIFHEFTYSGRMICDLLEKRKIAHGWIYGGTKQAVKEAQLEAFQRGALRVLVLNAATGSMAIDLPMADYLCFYESPTSPTIRQQAEARPMGRGAKPLIIDDLVCSPVDRKVLGFVKEGKEALSSLIYDRDVRTGFFKRGKR